MGEPQLIDRLARNLIEQAGYVVAEKKFSPNEIEIHYIGLRDGEKLHEQLSYGEILPTNVPEIKCSDEVCSVNEVFLEDLLRSVFEGSLDILELVDWSKGEYKKVLLIGGRNYFREFSKYFPRISKISLDDLCKKNSNIPDDELVIF